MFSTEDSLDFVTAAMIQTDMLHTWDDGDGFDGKRRRSSGLNPSTRKTSEQCQCSFSKILEIAARKIPLSACKKICLPAPKSRFGSLATLDQGKSLRTYQKINIVQALFLKDFNIWKQSKACRL